jgi:hypothetical protein
VSGAGEGFEAAAEALLDAGRVWLDLIGRATATVNATAGGEAGATKADTPNEASALLGTIAEAQLAFLSAGLGYGLQIADLHARRATKIGQPLMGALGEGGLDDPARQALIEETRGYLREAAEIAVAEARTFARTLADIDQRLHAQAGGVNASAAPKRRWRAKD